MIRKDVLLLLRSPTELALLLLMPLILTAILGFALGSVMQGGGGPPISVRALLVVEDDEAAGMQAFAAAVATRDLPPAQQEGLLAAAQALSPQGLLRAMLASDGLSDMLSVEELPLAEAQAALDQGNAQALIRVPDGFTQDLLGSMLLDEGPGSELQVAMAENAPLGGSIVRDLAHEFARELNFRTALGQLGHGSVSAPPASGSVRLVESAQSISMLAYYTFAMAVMFVLYTAGAMSSRAVTELSSQSFDRILLSDAGTSRYLGSKFIATTLLGFLQLMFLLGVSNLLLRSLAGRPLEFWLGTAGITLALALCIGGLAALLTSINLRLGNRAIGDLFYSIVPMAFALVGGSLFPVEGTMARMGAWTPNGAANSALVKLSMGMDLSAWAPELLRLLGIGGVLLVLALFLLPTRKGVRA